MVEIFMLHQNNDELSDGVYLVVEQSQIASCILDKYAVALIRNALLSQQTPVAINACILFSSFSNSYCQRTHYCSQKCTSIIIYACQKAYGPITAIISLSCLCSKCYSCSADLMTCAHMLVELMVIAKSRIT